MSKFKYHKQRHKIEKILVVFFKVAIIRMEYKIQMIIINVFITFFKAAVEILSR